MCAESHASRIRLVLAVLGSVLLAAWPLGVARAGGATALIEWDAPEGCPGALDPLQEHITRTTQDEGTAAGVLSLEYMPNAAHEGWCALQPPRHTGEINFDCVGVLYPDDPAEQCPVEYSDESGEGAECNLYDLCLARNVCSCNEAECWLAPASPHDLWLTRDGEELLVSFVGAVFDYGAPGRYMPVGTVRFQRASE